MIEEKSIYENLSPINVEKFVGGKNGYRFLSWSNAVDQLLKKYPKASWKNREWNELPYLQCKAGCFVEVSVTINDVTRSQLHPILDFRNKPVKEPDAFQINTSIQRALAKAISLHGLGLYIYQGEDLPLSEKEATDNAKAELAQLLKDNDKYNASTLRILSSMTYDQLQEKIIEYRGK